MKAELVSVSDNGGIPTDTRMRCLSPPRHKDGPSQRPVSAKDQFVLQLQCFLNYHSASIDKS